jgi:glycosyltransferase involved in cell wall biosynthesis
MTKIAWIISGAEEYGERRAIISLMEGVRATGWEVCAASLTHGECQQTLEANGFPITTLGIDHTPGLHLARNLMGKGLQGLKLSVHQYSIRRRIYDFLQQRQVHAVHLLNTNILAAVGWAAQKTNIPLFWEMTRGLSAGFRWDINKRLYGRVLNRYDVQPLANSRYTADTLRPLHRPPAVMNLGADPVRFHPATAPDQSLRTALGIPEGALLFAIVARIDTSKGQEVFLQALQKVADPRVHLLLVGSFTTNSDRLSWEQRFQRVAPDEKSRVHLVGYTPAPEPYMAIADVHVNSRLDAEPFGLSVIEAMLMGKPVLVHALGGPAETVLDGKTGWHVQDPTVEGFAAGIRRCLDDRALWHEMGVAANDRALANYSIEKQVVFYQSIVNARLMR